MQGNNTLSFKLRVKRSDISYLRWTIESYDGMAVVRTLDPATAIIEVIVPIGCDNLFMQLLRYLIEHEKIPITPL